MTQRHTLYTLSKDLAALDDLLAGLDAAPQVDPPADGVASPSPSDAEVVWGWLGELDAQTDEKIEGVVRYLKHLERVSESYRKEAHSLSERASRLDRQAESLTEVLRRFLESRGVTTHQTSIGRISLDLPGGAPPVEVSPEVQADPLRLPKAYIRVRAEPDKTALRAGLRAKDPALEGLARLVTDRPRVLRIK